MTKDESFIIIERSGLAVGFVQYSTEHLNSEAFELVGGAWMALPASALSK